MTNQKNIMEYEENSRTEKISKLIDSYSVKIKNIPKEIVEQLKLRYIKGDKSYDEIQLEIQDLSKKIEMIEQFVNVDIDPVVLDSSIILIGPMGSGKSTIANLLREKYKMPHLSLDNREQLSGLYKQRGNFNNFKDFEFFLTVMVLTNLSEPTIIDFGAGHSIYENVAMFLEMKSLISRFNNVILLIPSKDKEESVDILNKRKGIKSGSKQDFDNRHFVDMPCNYELATTTVYTKDKLPEQIINEIINCINQKEIDNGKKSSFTI